MYLGSFAIDDYLPIPAVCHRFSTGAAYAPTSLTYSIYEDATTTGLDEDVDMVPASPFDSITGLYYARRQLTTAAGFESGKNYLVIVKATVDSVAAIETHVFQIGAKVVVTTNNDKTGYTASTVSDKTGYSLTQTFPTNFADLSISATTGLVTYANAAPPAASAIADAVWDEAATGHTDAGKAGAQVWTDIDAILDDTGTAGVIVASGTVTTLTNAPTGMALEATLTAIKGATWSATTDTLEAIRDRGDVAWLTATGFSTLDAAGIRTAVGMATANLDTQFAGLPTDADVNAACDTAISDAGLATALATVDGNVDTILAYGAPPTAAAVAAALAARKPSDDEATAAAGSYAFIEAIRSGQHKVTLADNLDGTGTLTLYKSNGSTVWGTCTVTLEATAGSTKAMTGVADAP